jgi:glycosyltransferase involved in cell wall biosynthesis
MRIALVNEFFPPFAPGGAEWSMDALARALAEKEHHVVVITPNYGAQAREMVSGVLVHRFPFPKKMRRGSALPGFVWHANPLFYLYSAAWIFGMAKKEAIDLIHVQNKYSLVGSLVAGRLLGIPVVCSIRDTSHLCRIAVCLHHEDTVPSDCGLKKLMLECSEEYYANYYERKNSFLHWKDKLWQLYHWIDVHLRRYCLNRASAVVGVSHGILSLYERSRAFTQPRLRRNVIYNFAEASTDKGDRDSEVAGLRKRYGLESKKVVLYVGGFSRGKGTSDFIEAMHLLRGQLKEVVAVMIGPGEPKDVYDNILMIRGVDHHDLIHFYRMATVVVVPSVCQESLSRVLLEALACGRPAIGTRVGGTPEAIVHGETGLLVERGNPDELSEAIRRIVSDDDLASAMGRQSKMLAESRFEKSDIIVQIEELYEDVIEQARSARLAKAKGR